MFGPKGPSIMIVSVSSRRLSLHSGGKSKIWFEPDCAAGMAAPEPNKNSLLR